MLLFKEFLCCLLALISALLPLSLRTLQPVSWLYSNVVIFQYRCLLNLYNFDRLKIAFNDAFTLYSAIKTDRRKCKVIHITYKSSVVAEMGDCGHNRHGRKRGGGAVSLLRRAGTPSNGMWPGQRSTIKWRPHPSSRLASIDMNRKLGAVPLLGGSCDPI